MNYVILNAVYDVNLFKSTVAEYNKYGYVTWETRLTRLKAGDVVYIKYSELPMESEARLLFRGEVLESGFTMTRHEIYDNNDETIVKAIKISNLQAIAYADTDKYNNYNLLSNYNVKVTRGGRYLYEENQGLVDSIESNISELSSVNELVDYFEDKVKLFNDSIVCSCGKNHNTFIRADGTKYFEIHHLVPQCTIQQLGLSIFDVDSSDNKFRLCSNCHNEIHYGMQERKRILLKKLYLCNKKWYDVNFQKNAGKMSVINWIYKLYNIEAGQK